MYSAVTATTSISEVEHCSTRKSISIVTGHCEIPFTVWGLERDSLTNKYKDLTSDLQHYIKSRYSSAHLKSKHKAPTQVDSWACWPAVQSMGNCDGMNENGSQGLFGLWLMGLFGKDEEEWLCWRYVNESGLWDLKSLHWAQSVSLSFLAVCGSGGKLSAIAQAPPLPAAKAPWQGDHELTLWNCKQFFLKLP